MTELAVHYATQKVKLSEGHLAFPLSPRPCAVHPPTPFLSCCKCRGSFPQRRGHPVPVRREATSPFSGTEAFSHSSHLTCASSSSPRSLAPSIPTLKHVLDSSALKINVSKQKQRPPYPMGPSGSSRSLPFAELLRGAFYNPNPCFLTAHVLLSPFQHDFTWFSLTNAADQMAPLP